MGGGFRATHLIDHGRAVLPHLRHDVLRCLLARCNLRLGGDGKGVDERLWMGLADVREQPLYERTDPRTGRVNARNDLE